MSLYLAFAAPAAVLAIIWVVDEDDKLIRKLIRFSAMPAPTLLYFVIEKRKLGQRHFEPAGYRPIKCESATIAIETMNEKIPESADRDDYRVRRIDKAEFHNLGGV